MFRASAAALITVLRLYVPAHLLYIRCLSAPTKGPSLIRSLRPCSPVKFSCTTASGNLFLHAVIWFFRSLTTKGNFLSRCLARWHGIPGMECPRGL
ncbi:hypothetical protein F5141DRAFT_752439 [Pisolithus sp. B1]|nr:hypothetical protein F5141DRAFT_752439 [Pisolithus sp. B1]